MARQRGVRRRLADLATDHPEIAARLLLAADVAVNREEFGSITSPRGAAEVFAPHMIGLQHEELWVLGVNRRRIPVSGPEMLTVGSGAFCIVDPRQIYRWALRQNVAVTALFLAHNHPSGDPTPSAMDREITERVAAAGRLLGIPLLDHFVIAADGRWTSLAEEGVIPGIPGDIPLWTQ